MAISAFSQTRRTVIRSAPCSSMRAMAAAMIFSLFSSGLSFDSLRLTKYAQEKGITGIITKLFDAYFTRNLKLSDHDVLAQIAGECGLDKDEVTAVLSGNRYADEVRADEQEAMEHGIHGVPYFLINGKYTASGAQPTAMLKKAIEKILAKETSAATSLDGMVCGADGCHIVQ